MINAFESYSLRLQASLTRHDSSFSKPRVQCYLTPLTSNPAGTRKLIAIPKHHPRKHLALLVVKAVAKAIYAVGLSSLLPASATPRTLIKNKTKPVAFRNRRNIKIFMKIYF